MLLNCCHKAVQDAGEYYPAAALHKYHVLLLPHKDQPHKDQQYRQYRDLSIILPLSLLCCLVRYLNHPTLGAELQKPDPPKRLGEQIGKLILGVDVACLDAPFLQTASDEVIPHPDVLSPFMENGVLCQGQSGLVVHSELHRSSVSAKEITEQSSEPDRLSRSGGGRDVLSLAAGQGHHLLFD
jgi:hypothetical protein